MKSQSKKENLQFQVGLFFVLGLGFTFLAIFLLGSKKGLFTDQYTIYTYFNDISGVRVGSPVQLAGIKIGVVSEISFEEYEGEEAEAQKEETNETPIDDEQVGIVKVKIAMELNRDYANRVCTDSKASVVTEGLLGDRVIFLTVGCRKSKSGTPTPLKDGEVIYNSFEPTGFATLVDQGDVLMRDAQVFVKNTNKLVNELNKTLAAINQGNGVAYKLIHDKEFAKSFDNLEQTIHKLDQASANLENITRKVDEGEGTVGALLNDASLYHEIKMLLGKANRNKLIKSIIRYTVETKEKDQLK